MFKNWNKDSKHFTYECKSAQASLMLELERATGILFAPLKFYLSENEKACRSLYEKVIKKNKSQKNWWLDQKIFVND